MKFTSFCTLLILAFPLLFLSACKEKKHSVDIKKVKLEVNYRRLDRDLFPAERKTPDEIIALIKARYPDFYKEYFMGVLALGNPDAEEFNIPLAGFTKDVYINQLVDEVNIIYSQTNEIEKEITDAFKRYHKLFPEAVIPRVVFCISGLNYAVVATDSVMAIGLDMFLGKDYEAYKAMGFPDYICERKDKKHLISESLQGWMLSEFPKDTKRNSLIDHMVYNGKIMFLLQVLLPDYSDGLLFGYSDESEQFIKENEAMIWSYFIENKLLFSEDKREIMKFVEEAPFAAGMPREVPGRIGNWVGRNIVKSYMNNNKDVTFAQLMADNDYKTIFTKSKYKPKFN